MGDSIPTRPREYLLRNTTVSRDELQPANYALCRDSDITGGELTSR